MFDIRVLPADRARPNAVKAEVVLGEHRETFPLIATRWVARDYEQQWYGAVEALVTSRVKACMLVTDVQNPRDSTGITYWALFREGERVYIQERLMRTAPAVDLLVRPTELEPLIPPRIQGSEKEHEQVSEWLIFIPDLVDFLNRRDRPTA